VSDDNSTQFSGDGHQSLTTSPQLTVSHQPLILSAKEHSRKRNLKEKYRIDDLELKNTLGLLPVSCFPEMFGSVN